MTPINWSEIRQGIVKWGITSLAGALIGSIGGIYATQILRAEKVGEDRVLLRDLSTWKDKTDLRLTQDETEFRAHRQQDTVKDEHNRNLEVQNAQLIKRVDHMTEVFEAWLLGQKYKPHSENSVGISPPQMSVQEISKALAGIGKPGEKFCQRGNNEQNERR